MPCSITSLIATMGNSTGLPRNTVPAVGEETPLLLNDSSEEGSKTVLNFRRSINKKASSRRGSAVVGVDARSSVRGKGARYGISSDDQDAHHSHHELRPIDALAPLVAGGVIVATDGYTTAARPRSLVKSLPAFAPFPRKARHRAFALWWLNEFRHWWKSR